MTGSPLGSKLHPVMPGDLAYAQLEDSVASTCEPRIRVVDARNRLR
jgi:hypothetical protein